MPSYGTMPGGNHRPSGQALEILQPYAGSGLDLNADELALG